MEIVTLAGVLALASCSSDDPVRSSFATELANDEPASAATSAMAETVEPSQTRTTASEPATTDETTPADSATGSAPVYPRSFHLGERIVTIAEEPVQIAALSTDVAEVVLVLAGPERMVALPDSNTTEAVGSNLELAALVPNHISFGDPIDESVLRQWAADLVVISPNHSLEAQLARNLEDSDIPVLTMPNSWDDLEDAHENILLIGEAVGAEARAQAIVADMKQRAEQVEDRLDDLGDRPSVMILTNLPGVPFVVGPGVSTTDLVWRAGGVNAAHVIGIQTTIGPITAAQIAEAEPDRILLIDGLGTGRSAFQTLLRAPDLADLGAITDDRILVLPARISFGVAHTLIDGLEAIVDWLHPAA